MPGVLLKTKQLLSGRGVLVRFECAAVAAQLVQDWTGHDEVDEVTLVNPDRATCQPPMAGIRVRFKAAPAGTPEADRIRYTFEERLPEFWRTETATANELMLRLDSRQLTLRVIEHIRVAPDIASVQPNFLSRPQ